jgi:pilus assembly protein CpaE
MAKFSIVIMDTDAASRRNLENIIKGMDNAYMAGVAVDLTTGYEMALRVLPNMVIIGLDSDPELSYETIAKLVKQLPNVCILASSHDTSSENILNTIRQGATDFLPMPVREADLIGSIKRNARLMLNSRAAVAADKGHIITCFSPKGGMGNTTIATNLAVSLHQVTGKEVVLVDLDLECGDLSMFLNLHTKYTFSDVTENVGKLDSVFLQGVLAKHSSGIYFLSEPEKVEEAAAITPAQVHEVLNLLKTMFPYIVVDTEIGYGDRNLSVFDSSDLVFMTGVLSLPALKNMQKALDVFERIGFDAVKIKLLINRYLRKGDISIEDAERTLNYKVFKSIPNDFINVMMSINRGQPLTTLAPAAEVSRSFKELAASTRDLVAVQPKKAGAAVR